jgi:hypothetical protein
MKRLIRNTILWLTLLAGWVAVCASPCWVMNDLAIFVGLASLPLIPVVCGVWRRN